MGNVTSCYTECNMVLTLKEMTVLLNSYSLPLLNSYFELDNNAYPAWEVAQLFAMAFLNNTVKI